MNPYARPDSGVPLKPKKLTPLYSKKRSELKKIELANADDVKKAEKESNKRIKKPKSTKKSQTIDIIDSTAIEPVSNNVAIAESLEFDQPSNTIEAKQQEPEPPKPIENLPKNPIDLIWSTANLMPKVEDQNSTKQLPTIGEEFSLSLKRTKSFLGGRVFRDQLDEENSFSNKIITTSEIINQRRNSKGNALDLKSDDSAMLLINSASSSSSI